jgi:hypothetical protein
VFNIPAVENDVNLTFCGFSRVRAPSGVPGAGGERLESKLLGFWRVYSVEGLGHCGRLRVRLSLLKSRLEKLLARASNSGLVCHMWNSRNRKRGRFGLTMDSVQSPHIPSFLERNIPKTLSSILPLYGPQHSDGLHSYFGIMDLCGFKKDRFHLY